MKTNLLLPRPASSFSLRPLLLFLTTVLTAALWLLAGNKGMATPDQCTVCHKNTTTYTFSCASLEYQRHLDHGDTMGACGGSMTVREGGKAKE